VKKTQPFLKKSITASAQCKKRETSISLSSLGGRKTLTNCFQELRDTNHCWRCHSLLLLLLLLPVSVGLWRGLGSLSGWFSSFSKSWCWEEEESPYGATIRRGEGVKREETMEERSANMEHVATVMQAAAASVSTASTKQRVTIFQATIPSVLFSPSGME